MDIPKLPRRDIDSHKGSFGSILIVGGSRGMAGAVALAGMAAIHSGAGRVTLAVPESSLETVAGFEPSYMTVPLPQDTQGRLHADASSLLDELSAKSTSVGLGPGLSTSQDLTTLVGQLYAAYKGPMAVDADALNALATLPIDSLVPPAGPRVLTPHVGEFRRLVQNPSLSPAECRREAASFATINQAIVVLKGHQSLVTDGRHSFENPTGNPGMATGGSGDVLTGVITALLSLDMSPFESAQLGVYVHGLAGDLTRDRMGEISMTAKDIVNHLAPAFLSLERGQ